MNRAQVMDAPVGLLPLPRPLMTGEVLDAAFRLFRAGILRCLPYSALMVLILQLPSLYSLFVVNPFATFPGTQGWVTKTALGFLVTAVLSVPLLGVITLRLDAVARGVRPRFRTEIATALWRWLPGTIATAGAFAIPVMLYSLGPAFSNGLTSEAVFFLAIPLFWPTALFVVALPAFWSDRRGPFAAIAHSVRLSARRSWRMVGAILATVSMIGVFYVLVAMIVGLLIPMFARADLFLITTIRETLNLVVGAFGVPFAIAMLIVAQQDLELRARERRGEVA